MGVIRATPSFECIKGEDFEIDWTILSSSTGAAVDITGYTFALKLKRRDSDADPSLITPTITIQVAASGTVKAVFAAAATVLLLGDYRYAFWRTNAGAMSCLASGIFSVRDTVQN
jgi:hypothetical protein